MITVRRLALAWLVFVAMASVAEAQTCTISSTSVAFPSYSVFNSSDTHSTGTVTIKCLLPTSVTVDLSKGSSTTFIPRTMKDGSASIEYNLFRDSGHSVVWGDGSSGTSRYGPATTPTNTDVVLIVYGEIRARQDVTAGTYTDTITATITY